MKITSKTKTVGLIGHPVAHSRSPDMHNAAFQHLGLPYVYLAYDIPTENLSQAIRGMKALGFLGWNVTVPHKVNIIDYLDDLDVGAREIGAVNTVVRRNRKWIGYNTDGLGYLQSLKEEADVDLKGKTVVMLGAGGAARAVGYTLATSDIGKLVIANRTMSRAEQLAEHLSRWTKIDVQPIQDLRRAIREASLVVNTTSVGMIPDTDKMPIDPEWLHSDLVVSDLIYAPRQTALLQAASSIGARTHNGLGMLVHQAALAFELWLKVKAPVSLMRSVLDQSLSSAKEE